MKHNGHLMDVLTNTKGLTDVLMPPRPYRHKGEHTNAWAVLETKIGIQTHGGVQT